MSGDASRALNHAYRLLGYRQRSEKELYARLVRKGFGQDVVEEAVARLKEYGYLDDSEFASVLRRKAEEEKFLGAMGANRYLRQMGIPADTAEEILTGYDEASVAETLVRKKRGSMKGYPGTVRRKRLLGYLKRRGFSARTIRNILGQELKEDVTW